MRGNAAAHDMVAPGTLSAVLDLLAAEPGKWTPIAGGTELMVAHAAGRLTSGNLVSVWDIPDLRFVETTPESIALGGGSTFRDLRTNETIAAEFPLLAEASTWIGAIANQNRATLAGNIVNGSPAADSSPALLVYDAEIELVSVRGKRRVPYHAFHTGYKRSLLAPDELVLTVHLPRRFAAHCQYIRKVGTRRAMAISKVALAGTALIRGGVVSEVRVAAASLAPYPSRMRKAEAAIFGNGISPETMHAARRALLDEARPIDDIRSTAEYRRRVGANLLEEFLAELAKTGGSG